MSKNLNRRELIKSLAVLVSSAAAAPVFGKPKASLPSFFDYRSNDALSLAALVKNKDVSAEELLEMAIRRTEEINPKINCVVEKLYDSAMANIKKGLPEGPFKGVPLLLKDLGLALEGTITTNGSRFYQSAVMNYSSTIVQRYQRSGFVIFGKTASPEFGATATTESLLFGNTHNPWNLSLSTGGSSGGAAAAVAAGILPLANASDGGGSIRIPASCCGLFGMKPSRGRVPMGPKSFETVNALSVIHAISRSVRDSAALLDATHGTEPGSPYSAPTVQRPYLEVVHSEPIPLRIAYIKTPITRSPVHPDCIAAADYASKLCESLGHHVEESELPVDPEQFFSAFGAAMSINTLLRVRAREKQLKRAVREADLEPINWQTYQNAQQISGEELATARDTCNRIGYDIAVFQKHYDVILSPTLATIPFALGKLSLNQPYADYAKAAINASAFTMLYNATGQPAMSVPLYWANNLPIGVMFAGRYGDESTLFQLAAQLERAQPWFDRTPQL